MQGHVPIHIWFSPFFPHHPHRSWFFFVWVFLVLVKCMVQAVWLIPSCFFNESSNWKFFLLFFNKIKSTCFYYTYTLNSALFLLTSLDLYLSVSTIWLNCPSVNPFIFLSCEPLFSIWAHSNFIKISVTFLWMYHHLNTKESC